MLLSKLEVAFLLTISSYSIVRKNLHYIRPLAFSFKAIFKTK